MKLNGSIADNLRAAITSAKRLRNRPVHPDTLRFWQELLEHARQEQPLMDSRTRPIVDGMIATLEMQIAQRETPQV